MEIWEKLTAKKKEQDAALVKDLHALVISTGREQEGLDFQKFTEDEIESIIETSAITKDEFDALVRLYVHRLHLARDGQDVEAKQATAAKLDAELQAMITAEGNRHHAALTANQNKQAAWNAAQNIAIKAHAARGDLMAMAHSTDEERSLSDQCVELKHSADTVAEKLKTVVHFEGYGATIGDHPAVLLRETKEAIAAGDRSREMADRLKIATAAVAEWQKKLDAIHTRQATINKRLEEISAAKLSPEFLPPRAPAPPIDRDEAAKKLAKARGLAPIS